MFELRDYQTDLVSRVWEHLQEPGSRVLAQLPTGGGKSACQAELVRLASQAVRQGWQVLICVHRRELVEQLAASVQFHTGITPELVTAGSSPNWSAAVLVGMNQTLARRLAQLPQTLALVLQDEAHHSQGRTYRALYDALPTDCRLSGWTATPARLDGKALADVYDVLECGPGTHELIERGFLAPFRYLSADLMSVEGVRRTGGDYNVSDLARENNPVVLAAGVVDSVRRHAYGKRIVVFCINIAHSRQVAWSLTEADIPALHVDGSTPPEERARAIADFKAGRVRALCSCDLFSEGLDIPGIEAGILARPTASLTIHLQQIGRTLRTAPGKDCAIIIDLAGNWTRHGLPDDIRLWTLDGKVETKKKRRKVTEDGEVVIVPPREVIEGDADLDEIHSATNFSWAKLLAEQEAGGHPDKWLWHQMRRRDDVPLKDWRKLMNMLGYRSGWASHQWRCWTLRQDAYDYPEQREKWETWDREQALRYGVPPVTVQTPAPITLEPLKVQPPLQMLSPLPVVPTALQSAWTATLARLGSMRGTQMLLQQQGRLMSIDADQVVVVVEAKWIGTLRLRQEAIASAFSQVLGRPITLQFSAHQPRQAAG